MSLDETALPDIEEPQQPRHHTAGAGEYRRPDIHEVPADYPPDTIFGVQAALDLVYAVCIDEVDSELNRSAEKEQ
jgi:hypothetical protein